MSEQRKTSPRGAEEGLLAVPRSLQGSATLLAKIHGSVLMMLARIRVFIGDSTTSDKPRVKNSH